MVFPEIYTQLEEEGVGGYSDYGYMCIVLYMSEIYLVSWVFRDLCLIGGGVGSIWHGYMCIVQYLKLIWCNGFPEIYAELEEGWWGQSAVGICALYYIYIYIWNWFGVMVFQRSMLDWRRGRVNMPWVYVNFAIYIWNWFGVMVFQRSMLDWMGDGVNLPWVYVHCAIYETNLV